MVEESRRWFDEGLTGAYRDAAREHGWTVEGKVDIAYEADATRRPGVPSAIALWPSPDADGRASSAPRTTEATGRSRPDAAGSFALVRSDTGERIPLRGERVTLGRARDRDIVVNDSRVSRSHVRFERDERGWVLVDEGSSNGTLLRNRPVPANRPVPISVGDVVSVGPVELTLGRDENSTNPGPGTRALDDSDRNRISREFLPPGDGR